MNYLKISIGIFIALAASRFIPHPPNFTSLIALSFYVPAIFGIKFIPFVIISFIATDIIIGFHSTLIFTWGSVIVIGLVSKYLNDKTSVRLYGTFLSCLIFFILTNFGVWIGGSYGYNIGGLLSCYYLALPFFGNTLASTMLFAVIIEFLYINSKKLINFKFN